jgi:hypothetical protein
MPNVTKPANASPKRAVASSQTAAPGAKSSPTRRTIRATSPKIDLRVAIERRAYELWEAEGRPGGRDQSHWYRAEQELAQMRGRGPKRAPTSAMAS